jgi:hypothetical protein
MQTILPTADARESAALVAAHVIGPRGRLLWLLLISAADTLRPSAGGLRRRWTGARDASRRAAMA